MTNLMPQEIEVWYLLPALRRELAGIFINEHKLKQKEAAALLGLTEAAISQYRKAKRGKELNFSECERKIIADAAKKIIADKKSTEHFYNLCKNLRGSQTLCALHKKLDGSIHQNCNMCSDEIELRK